MICNRQIDERIILAEDKMTSRFFSKVNPSDRSGTLLIFAQVWDKPAGFPQTCRFFQCLTGRSLNQTRTSPAGKLPSSFLQTCSCGNQHLSQFLAGSAVFVFWFNDSTPFLHPATLTVLLLSGMCHLNLPPWVLVWRVSSTVFFRHYLTLQTVESRENVQ